MDVYAEENKIPRNYLLISASSFFVYLYIVAKNALALKTKFLKPNRHEGKESIGIQI